MPWTNISLDTLSAIITAILLGNCLKEKPTSNRQRLSFVGVLATLLIILLTDLLDWTAMGNPILKIPLLISNGINYTAGYVILSFFIRYLQEFLLDRENRLHGLLRLFDILCVLSIVLVVVNFPTGIYYTIDAAGMYHRGSLYWLSQAFPIFSLLADTFLILYWPGLHRRDRLIFITYPLFPLLGIFIDLFQQMLNLTYIGAFLSIFIIYLHIYSMQNRLLAQRETELQQANIAIMLSQIQPHFLFNALSSIIQLCEEDPPTAKQATLEFSRFLRGNLDSLSASHPISFEQELAHTRHYLSLELLRFPDRLQVRYDIQATHFLIPTLTLQPLVENAVRYGVTERQAGGTVTIASRETDTAYIVTVSDDGVGFDPQRPHNDGRTHIGIRNVRDRITRMSGGTLSIQSTPNVGTVTEIFLPKDGQRLVPRPGTY